MFLVSCSGETGGWLENIIENQNNDDNQQQQQPDEGTLEGSVTKVFNYIFPSAYAEEIPQTSICTSECTGVYCIKLYVVNEITLNKTFVCQTNIDAENKFKFIFADKNGLKNKILKLEAYHTTDSSKNREMSMTLPDSALEKAEVTPATTILSDVVLSALVKAKKENASGQLTSTYAQLQKTYTAEKVVEVLAEALGTDLSSNEPSEYCKANMEGLKNKAFSIRDLIEDPGDESVTLMSCQYNPDQAKCDNYLELLDQRSKSDPVRAKIISNRFGSILKDELKENISFAKKVIISNKYDSLLQFGVLGGPELDPLLEAQREVYVDHLVNLNSDYNNFEELTADKLAQKEFLHSLVQPFSSQIGLGFGLFYFGGFFIPEYAKMFGIELNQETCDGGQWYNDNGTETCCRGDVYHDDIQNKDACCERSRWNSHSNVYQDNQNRNVCCPGEAYSQNGQAACCQTGSAYGNWIGPDYVYSCCDNGVYTLNQCFTCALGNEFHLDENNNPVCNAPSANITFAETDYKKYKGDEYTAFRKTGMAASELIFGKVLTGVYDESTDIITYNIDLESICRIISQDADFNDDEFDTEFDLCMDNISQGQDMLDKVKILQHVSTKLVEFKYGNDRLLQLKYGMGVQDSTEIIINLTELKIAVAAWKADVAATGVEFDYDPEDPDSAMMPTPILDTVNIITTNGLNAYGTLSITKYMADRVNLTGGMTISVVDDEDIDDDDDGIAITLPSEIGLDVKIPVTQRFVQIGHIRGGENGAENNVFKDRVSFNIEYARIIDHNGVYKSLIEQALSPTNENGEWVDNDGNVVDQPVFEFATNRATPHIFTIENFISGDFRIDQENKIISYSRTDDTGEEAEPPSLTIQGSGSDWMKFELGPVKDTVASLEANFAKPHIYAHLPSITLTDLSGDLVNNFGSMFFGDNPPTAPHRLRIHNLPIAELLTTVDTVATLSKPSSGLTSIGFDVNETPSTFVDLSFTQSPVNKYLSGLAKTDGDLVGTLSGDEGEEGGFNPFEILDSVVADIPQITFTDGHGFLIDGMLGQMIKFGHNDFNYPPYVATIDNLLKASFVKNLDGNFEILKDAFSVIMTADKAEVATDWISAILPVDLTALLDVASEGGPVVKITSAHQLIPDVIEQEGGIEEGSDTRLVAKMDFGTDSMEGYITLHKNLVVSPTAQCQSMPEPDNANDPAIPYSTMVTSNANLKLDLAVDNFMFGGESMQITIPEEDTDDARCISRVFAS
ncbi:MAG: hypothetical protein V1695_02130, partial [Candidatus Uhrbacteria bacterium]